jgi:hypothetical protein
VKTIHIHHVYETPELNGDLSQPAWKNVQWNSGFTLVNQPEVKALDNTIFAMIHDAENLYIAIKTKVLDLTSQPAYYQKEDPKGEFQVMIDSESSGLRTGLFFLFGDGTSYAQIVKSDAKSEKWPGTIRCAFKTEGDTWVAMLAVGLAQFKYAASSNLQWNFNLVRLPSRHAEQLWSTFTPLNEVSGEFFLPKHVKATAKFDDPSALSAFLWTVAKVGRGRIVETENGFVCRQCVKISNLANENQAVELQCSVGPGDAVVLPLQIGPKQSRTETVDVPVDADFNFDQFYVTLVEPATLRCLSKSGFLVEAEPLSWKKHFVRQEDGKGGCICHPAQMQFLPRFEDAMITPFGLAQMDNGEIILAGFASSVPERTIVAFSQDRGATWSEYKELRKQTPDQGAGSALKPMMLTYLGKGSLSVIQGDTGGKRLFSHDYGRTWDEEVPLPPAPDGYAMGVEGNAMVDRDEQGNAVRIAETGQTWSDGGWPANSACLWIRWSYDGGRTWVDASRPEAWKWQETYKGKVFNCGGYEGALVRAANGWIVAGLRMSPAPKHHEHPFLDDNLMGTGFSISKDDGKTWSPIKRIFDAGRMHANLVRLPNDDLVMTVIRRTDFRNGKLASYRRGCDAVISHDNGLTWDVEHLYTIDDTPYCEGERWLNCVCGHLYSIVLDNGSILTAFGNFLSGGELIKWKP